MTNTDSALVSRMDNASSEQMGRANAAVEANLVDGQPKWDSAQGYACALTAILADDDRIEQLTAELAVMREALSGIANAQRLGAESDLVAWANLAFACQETARKALNQQDRQHDR